jgi:hypothetical protein
MTNNPLAMRRTPQFERPTESVDARVARWNAELKRSDVAWVVGHDGSPKLQHVETQTDRDLNAVKWGRVTQAEIDRMPFNLRSIAWNRCYLNCDYAKPPRYWLPGQIPGNYAAPAPASQGIDWWNEP